MLGDTGSSLHCIECYLCGLIRRGPLCTGEVPVAVKSLPENGVVWLFGRSTLHSKKKKKIFSPKHGIAIIVQVNCN